jgi:hypothetical protein
MQSTLLISGTADVPVHFRLVKSICRDVADTGTEDCPLDTLYFCFLATAATQLHIRL